MEFENKPIFKNILSLLDVVFVANGEMVKSNGEDSFGYSFNENGGVLAVFDGCGGLGSRKYERYSAKTGAYIASRVASEAICGWFANFSSQEKSVNYTSNEIAAEIYKALHHALQGFINNSGGATLMKGFMTREFPTTASIIVCNYINAELKVFFIWAGDSRGYILTGDGLIQMTRDDIDSNEDAYTNLSNDAKLENVISADGKYHLNSKEISCQYPAILITATDGCFGYFSTPMEFEYMIIETLVVSSSIVSWEKNLTDYMRRFAGDDFTLGIAALGYSDFKNLKKSYVKRHQFLYQSYIKKLHNADKDQILIMWNEYKKFYQRGLQ